MVKLNKIYTRTGDKGTTGLASGPRRLKSDLRVEAYGTVDENNACIGMARLHTGGEDNPHAQIDAMLGRIQNDLFDLGADLSTPDDGKPLAYEPLRIVASQVSRVEADIDLRNAIMLAIAFGVAAAQKAEAIALAVHGGDHFIYPDCRPGFIDAFQTMQNHALDGYADIKLLAPYVHASKADIVIDGAKYGTPFAATWSCYKGGEHHCGRCGTCVGRREAFHLAGIQDPTLYEDADFWRSAIEKRNA